MIKSIQIEEDRFGFEAEITAKLVRMGCRIYEVGISYSGRTYAEGKKINWKDGVRAIYAIVKYNHTISNGLGVEPPGELGGGRQYRTPRLPGLRAEPSAGDAI